jgi:branched-subunit amino acid transport protein
MHGDTFDWYVLTVIGLLALCTVLTRAGYHLFGQHVPLGDGVRRALRYAPAAALTAIIVPILLPWGNGGMTLAIDERLLSAVIAVILFRKTHNNLIMIAGGMVAFWVIRAVLQGL